MDLRYPSLSWRKFPRLFGLVLLVLFFGFFSQTVALAEDEDYKILREIIVNEFRDHKAEKKGGDHGEVIKTFPATDKRMAIGVVACLDMGAEIDLPLLEKLAARKIPFSIFTDQAWLKQHELKLKPFVENNLTQFENHGSFCRALSVDGKITGNFAKTSTLEEVFEEVEDNARAIERFSGRLPRFYRSGQSYYDDVALKIVNVLGYQAVEGDLKLKAKDVESPQAISLFFKNVRPGSIIFMPANRPGASEKWVDLFVSGISKAGYSAVSLDDVIGNEAEDI